MQERRISIKNTIFKSSSCNSCHAHIRDSALGPIGEIIEESQLYELQIGGMVTTLCDKCLGELARQIKSVI